MLHSKPCVLLALLVASCSHPAPRLERAERAPAEVSTHPAPVTETGETPAAQTTEVAPTPDAPTAEAPPFDPRLECPPQDTWPGSMACVPGGRFTVGSDEGEPDEAPPGEVFVRSFFLDLYEVTNERYTACVAAGVCQHPQQRYRHFQRANQPVVAVRWLDAQAYCEWVGGRLPTDAEFERAARGPDGTRYPFGDDTSDACERAVIRTHDGPGCGTDVTAEVGSRPPGHYGIYDLAGNVHEWVLDHWAPCLRGCRRECGDACFGDNPRGPCDGAEECPGHRRRSIRGGSWYWPVEHARAAARRGADPENEGGHRFGFRCARDLPTEP